MADPVIPIPKVPKVESGNDKFLVDLARSGDRQAFDLLVIKYQSRLLKLVLRLITNEADALDVVQDAFVKAYRSLESFREQSTFYTWLYRIAVNSAKNHLSSMSKQPMNISLSDDYGITERLASFHDRATPDRLIQATELELAILDAINKLPDDLREALTLRELEAMNYEEIAHAMDCPIGTVRSRIFRARDYVISEISERFPGTFF